MDKNDKNDAKIKKPDGLQTKPPYFPPRLVMLLADEVAKTVVQRLPGIVPHPQKSKKKSQKKIENAVFLDTSAIIDGRIFAVINLGLPSGVFVIMDSILLELKHIADSQDVSRRERGRMGLDFLDKLKKGKRTKVVLLSENEEKKLFKNKKLEVDERLINVAKFYKGMIITCDYNLEKKGSIQGIKMVNVNALSQALKIRAVPGESVHIKIQHVGKDAAQGVGYLDDGTMVVVEGGRNDIGRHLDVVIIRVIQTVTGRILFARKID
ncbi:TRAM domain-containing protein [Patescibacteria group bacterium]|nr:TRAM domain-containing protein [Patescibacteria group bacterium]